MRKSRCLPWETTFSTARPARSTVAIRGMRKSVGVSVWRARAACNRVAARKTVSPSGTDAHAPRRGVESRLRECAGDGRVEHGLAVGALHLEPAEAAFPRRRRQRLGGRLHHALVVAVRQQPPPPPLALQDAPAAAPP